MRIDKEYTEKAKAEGLPMFRVQIDWRFVPKEQRPLKSHESVGVLDVDEARTLLQFCLSDFLKRAAAEGMEKAQAGLTRPEGE